MKVVGRKCWTTGLTGLHGVLANSNLMQHGSLKTLSHHHSVTNLISTEKQLTNARSSLPPGSNHGNFCDLTNTRLFLRKNRPFSANVH